jgi:hypothetical protein
MTVQAAATARDENARGRLVADPFVTRSAAISAFQLLSIRPAVSPVLATTALRKGAVSSAFESGRTWDRTRDLPRVKRALSR